MMRQPVWLDLCSGLGGASQPALDRGWKVIRVDIDRRFKPDIVADVRRLPFKDQIADVIWASPPCTEFTKTGMPKSWFKTHNQKAPTLRGLVDSILLVRACHCFGQTARIGWIIENTRGSRRWLSRRLGTVRAMTSGHVLWSNLPFLIPTGLDGRKWKIGPTKDYRERAALRARIPYEIGEAICKAVEAQLS